MAERSDDDFKRMVAYFYEEKGDPTRWVHWDAERCMRLMPDFYLAWSHCTIYARLATLALKEATKDLES